MRQKLAGRVYYSGRFGALVGRLKKSDRRGGVGTFQHVRKNYKLTNLTVVARRHPVLSPAWCCILF